MKENIKIALLGVIAVTLIAQTFMSNGGQPATTGSTDKAQDQSISSLTAPPQPNKPEMEIVPQTVEPEVPAGPTTKIEFAEDLHDFGTVKQDSKNEHLFKFTNTGDEPLIISNAKGSCGCTVPKYPKNPIAPGETGEIEVVYSPGKQKGQQSKTVTITANTDPKDTRIQIKANVEEI